MGEEEGEIMRRWIMTTVAERFKAPNGVPKERLACGCVRTDPIFHYGNEASVRIKRAFECLTPEQPIKARCYKCARKEEGEE